MVVADRHVIAHELAEWSLGPASARQDAALDHDLGVDRHVEIDGAAAAQGKRRTGDLAGDLHLVLVIGVAVPPRRARAQRRAMQDRSFECFAARLGLGLVLGEMMRAPEPNAQLRVADDLAAMERQVGNAAVGLARQKDTGRQVGPAVALEIGDLRQVGEADLFEVVRGHRRSAVLVPAGASVRPSAGRRSRRWPPIMSIRRGRLPNTLVMTGKREPATLWNRSGASLSRCDACVTAASSCLPPPRARSRARGRRAEADRDRPASRLLEHLAGLLGHALGHAQPGGFGGGKVDLRLEHLASTGTRLPGSLPSSTGTATLRAQSTPF